MVLTALLEEGLREGHEELELHAQAHVKKFYMRHGFMQEGSEFMEAGIPHVRMYCQFN